MKLNDLLIIAAIGGGLYWWIRQTKTEDGDCRDQFHPAVIIPGHSWKCVNGGWKSVPDV